MDLARFKKKESSVGILVPAITEVLSDGKFWTRSLSRGVDCFGTDRTLEYFTSSNPEKRYKQSLISPKTDYEMFVLTTNPLEADLIAISYYAGTEFKDVDKSLGGKRFIVKDKLQIKTRKKCYEEEYEPFYDNSILKYRGLAHHSKKIDEVRYEGDCNTEIELHDDCQFKMYKFIGIQKAL